MGTLFVRFAVENDISWGVMEDGQVYKVSSDMSLKQLLQTKPYETAMKEKIEGNLLICSPVTRDSQLYCQGANYSTHREEVGLNAENICTSWTIILFAG
jgi:2-keto-4-pentenoate hydratase/2-oxohepta-3-ene-1,7-dioic acid hydratase in catechol pathway